MAEYSISVTIFKMLQEWCFWTWRSFLEHSSFIKSRYYQSTFYLSLKDPNKSLEVGSGGWSFGHNLGPNVRLVVGFPQRRENNAFHKCRLWSIYKFGNKLDKVIHSLSILFWTLLLDLLSLDSDPLLSDTASPLLNLDPLLLDLYLCLFQQISPVKCRSAKFISRYQSIPDIFSSCCFLGLLAPPLFVNLNDFVRNADNLCRKLYSKCSVEIWFFQVSILY